MKKSLPGGSPAVKAAARQTFKRLQAVSLSGVFEPRIGATPAAASQSCVEDQMEHRRDPEHDQELLDEAIEESFPASDPPGSGGSTPRPDEEDPPLLDPQLAD
jgi:hypothetical protein